MASSLWEILKSDREEDAQRYLAGHQSLLLEALGLPIRSVCIPKFRFGSSFISDFVVIIEVTWGVYDACLIEIEPPTSRAFTERGSFARRLNEAFAQVGDWIAWCQENRDYFFRSLLQAVSESHGSWSDSGSHVLEAGQHARLGAVYVKILIGRHRFLSPADEGRKLALYQQASRQVEIATYDRLVTVAILQSTSCGDVPKEVIRDALATDHLGMKQHIARTISDGSILGALFLMADFSIKVSLARNPHLPRNLWDELIQDANPKIRRVAGLEGAYYSHAVFAEAAVDSNSFVRQDAAKYGKDPETLARLAQDEKWFVRQAALETLARVKS